MDRVKIKYPLYLLFALFALAISAGCSDSDDGDSGNPVGMQLSSLVAEANEQSQFMDIICEGPWTLRFENPDGTEADWINCRQGSSGTGNTKVVLVYSANTALYDRTVDVILQSGGYSTRETFVQKSKGSTNPDVIMATLTNNSVLAPASSVYVVITSNTTWSLALEYPAGTAAWCSLSQSTGTGNTNVTLTYNQNTLSGSRSATVVATAGSDVSRVVLTQLGTGSGSVTTSGWIELPEVPSRQDCMFVTHNTTIGGKYVRNYSLYYDSKEKISYWVAYPLHKLYTQKVTSRTDKWAYDPQIPTNLQPNLSKSYTGAHSRGHQIASSDRLGSVNANNQTFYYTNQTPQIQNKFNSGIWSSLEEKVRSWAGSGTDTLYVVTGAVIRTVGGSEPTNNYEYDKSGTKITIPNYYYKVMVQQRTNGQYRAIGFWFEHKTYTDSYSNYVMSIRDIEQKTGFRFFSNLPQNVQDEIETKTVAAMKADWGL